MYVVYQPCRERTYVLKNLLFLLDKVVFIKNFKLAFINWLTGIDPSFSIPWRDTVKNGMAKQKEKVLSKIKVIFSG